MTSPMILSDLLKSFLILTIFIQPTDVVDDDMRESPILGWQLFIITLIIHDQYIENATTPGKNCLRCAL